MGTQKNRLINGSFEHTKHVFKLMDKKIIAILRIYFWLNWSYVSILELFTFDGLADFLMENIPMSVTSHAYSTTFKFELFTFDGLADFLMENIPMSVASHAYSTTFRERSGSVVECLTQDRRAVGSSLTGVTALWSLSKTHLS